MRPVVSPFRCESFHDRPAAKGFGPVAKSGALSEAGRVHFRAMPLCCQWKQERTGTGFPGGAFMEKPAHEVFPWPARYGPPLKTGTGSLDRQAFFEKRTCVRSATDAPSVARPIRQGRSSLTLWDISCIA